MGFGLRVWGLGRGFSGLGVEGLLRNGCREDIRISIEAVRVLAAVSHFANMRTSAVLFQCSEDFYCRLLARLFSAQFFAR